MKKLCLVLSLLLLASPSGEATDGQPAVDVIVDAFATHALVAVGEAHGNVSDHDFRLSLIRDPRLFARLDDVVVEFGNARYQHLVDRFVAGERVPERTLRHVWQDTTMPHMVWDRPIYEAFFTAVRDLNAGPRRTRPLRVLLGDPPIDWNSIRSADDQRRWQALRVTHAASIISKEIVDRKRRALIFYGVAHLWRADLSRETLIERLEATYGTRVFTVMPDDNRHVLGRSAPVVVPTIRLTRGTSLDNQVDAMLDLPGRETDPGSPLSPDLCRDRDYLDMRRHRLALVPGYQSFAAIERACAKRD
jgi:Haem-binding uptake, Tiki superfamily, ChaN